MLTSTVGSHVIDFDLLRSKSIIVDVGVCRCLVSDFIKDRLSQHTEQFTVYGFEPNIFNFEYLLGRYDNDIKLYNAVISGRIDKELKFISTYGSIKGSNYGVVERYHQGIGRVYKFEGDNINGVDCIIRNVKNIMINDIFDFLKVDYIDWLKMDIEGEEIKLIDAMTLETAKKIKQLSMEHHGDDTKKKDSIKKLKELKYTVIEKENKELYCVR